MPDSIVVSVHPRLRPLLGSLPRTDALVFPGITERQLLQRIKVLCAELEFPNADDFKPHSFRHHFASLCANHHVAYRKALAWLGHSSSDILDLYYHLHDSDSQAAMKVLAADTHVAASKPQPTAEGNLRATGESTIETVPQNEAEQALMNLLGMDTERAGFEPASRFKPATAFPVLLLRPLGHLSQKITGLHL